MRRALLLQLSWLLACAAPEVVAPNIELPEPPPILARPSAEAAGPTAPESSAPAGDEPAPPLGRFDVLSQRVLWVWVTEHEAAQLEARPKALFRLPSAAPTAPYGLTLRLQIDDAASRDDWSALLGKRAFGARRLAWPNLGGAVLLREPRAFVPVRVTLRPEAMVLEHGTRSARRLNGEAVPRAEALARAGELGVLFARQGKLRAFVLVNPAMVQTIEVGTDAVRRSFEQELRLLDAFAGELARADSFSSVRVLDRLRVGAVEGNAGWDVAERIEALRALGGVAVKGWSKNFEPRGNVDLRVLQPGPINVCKRLFHAGRKLAADEWCGTDAMSYHYCSRGCESGPTENCVPSAEAWK